MRRRRIAGREVGPQLLELLLRLQDGQHPLVQVAELLVGGGERPPASRRKLEDVVAEEPAAVAEMQQSQQRRRNVDLAHEAAHPLRRDVRRRVDPQRDVIAVHRQAGAAGARCIVVGGDHEHRVVEVRFPARAIDEVGDRPVGVGHRALARAVAFLHAPGGKGEGAVVGGGHDVQEERVALAVDPVHLAQRQRVQVLVGHAPHVLAMYGGVLGNVLAVHRDVSVVAEEVVHVVEVAVAAVDELRHVAAIVEDVGQREQVLVVVHLDHRVARRRRDRQRQRLQPAHRAGAVGVDVVEEQALVGERVQVRGDVAVARAESLQEIGREAFHADQHYVQVLLGTGVADRAGEVARIVAQVGGIGRLQTLAHTLERDLPGQGAIEARVVQVAAAEGVEELVDAVAGQLVDVGVVAAVLHGAVDRQHRDHRQHQPAEHHLAAGREPAAGIDRAQPAPGRPHDDQRQQADQAHPQPDRVRLADVADHLGGVDQIVDRDEVEAHAELAPEHELRGGHEQQPVHQQQRDQVERPLPGARHVGAPRHQPQEQQQRPGDVEQRHQVVAGADAEGVKPVQRVVRHAGTGHRQQHDAGRRADQQIGDAQPPERTKALPQRSNGRDGQGHGDP